ncbi:MAG: DUF3047 domain-containing protein [Pseudomonadota bacterium]
MSRRACLLAAALWWPVMAFADAPLLAQPAGSGDVPATSWQVLGLPQQASSATRFSVVTLDGERVLRVEAQAGYGNLVHPLPGHPSARHLRWRWRVDRSNPAADLRRRDADDNPLKVCALFDLPIEAVPFVERQLLRLARLRTGQKLPAASVCYVWDAQLPAGTVLDNIYSRRVRMIVLRGAEAGLRSWHAEQRDVRADFLRLFADEASTVPPLLGIGIAGDADNTLGHSVGHIGGITLD